MTTIPQFHRFINKKKLIPDSFNDEILKAVQLITYDESQITFAGSFIRKSMTYSADIDISETFPKRCTSEHIADALKTIVRKILVSDNYILDIKSGYDIAYEPYFNNLGNIKNDKVVGYDAQKTKNDIYECHEKGYIDKDVYDELISLNKNAKTSIMSWLDLHEVIRKLITLRWSPEDVLKGFKQGVNQQIELSTAVNTFVTKIDMVFIYQGFYTEMSNIFMTNYSSKHGLVFYPVSAQPKHYEDAIKFNLFEYVQNKMWLKALKRVFTLALLKNDQKLLKQIAPLLISSIGRLNKVTSIFTTIVDMLEKLSHPPMKMIKTQINNIKPVLSIIYEFPFGEKQIDETLDHICRSKKATMIKSINEVNEHCKKVINEQTLQYMKKNHINIPKSYFL